VKGLNIISIKSAASLKALGQFPFYFQVKQTWRKLAFNPLAANLPHAHFI